MYLGIDNKVKKLVIYEKRIALNIWDTAGQERFKSIAKSYFNKSDGVLLVFDLTNIDSFNSIEKWMQELNSFKKEANGSIVLVGNKCDIKNNTIKNEEIDELINKYNLKYFKASAKENKNIKQSFEYLAKDIYSKKVLHNNMKHERHKSKNKEMHDMVQNFVKYTF